MEPVDLSTATTEIRKYFPVMKHFIAEWTYIVTWYNVPHFGASSSEMEKVCMHYTLNYSFPPLLGFIQWKSSHLNRNIINRVME